MSKTNKILLLLSAVIFVAILLIRPKDKSGKEKTLYERSYDDIKSITYSGPIQLSNGKKFHIKYEVVDSKNKHTLYGHLWTITILSTNLPYSSSEQLTTPKDLAVLNTKYRKKMLGGNIIKSLVDDIRRLKFMHEVYNPQEKLSEFSLEPCSAFFQINFKREKSKKFCIGTTNFNKSLRYIQDENSGKVYLAHNYVFSRFEKDIFSYQETRLLPFEANKILGIKIKLGPMLKDKFPLIFARTNGLLEINVIENNNLPPSFNFKKFPMNAMHVVTSIKENLLNLRLIAYLDPNKKQQSSEDLMIHVELFWGSYENPYESKVTSADIYSEPYSKPYYYFIEKNPVDEYNYIAISNQNAGLITQGAKDLLLKYINSLEVELINEKRKAEAAKKRIEALEKRIEPSPKSFKK